MSLSGAINTAVSGLAAQSYALGVISDNIANASTVGYKSSYTSFSSLVTNSTTSSSYGSGGVKASDVAGVSQQGLISSTQSILDLAIDGNGMFIVSSSLDASDATYAFTRAGDFSVNDEGYLVNSSGMYLMGYPTDSDGSISVGATNSLSALEPIDVYAASGVAVATSELSLEANLPADADIGDTFTTSVEIFDSLGVSQTVDMNWEKTAANEWDLTYSDPVNTLDPSVTSGTASGGPVSIVFNDDGTLASTTPNPPVLDVTGWTSGAGDSSITLDLGTAGEANGLSQAASNEEEPSVDLGSISQNGTSYGSFSYVDINSEGAITAYFDNGQSQSIYQLSLATFANPDGLIAESGNLFRQSSSSGDFILSTPGDNGAGVISPSSLEESTVDIASEFSRMIVAQQAYSAASTVVTTADEMINTLISAVR
ncbi:flagellar hook protein FlgE [Kiloniella sp.]|uniref:flagellar hook protein FlgE n=1 Tax=Kiloniella sp. TaxID=1938587 RepID=UPI003B0245FE